MAKIPKIRDGDEIKETLVLGKQSFLLTIHKCKETHTLYMGGAHTYCINAIIFLPGSIYESYYDIKICTLDHLYYNELCSLSGGAGIDVQKIFHFLFSYIKNNYNYITTIQLKDYSTRTCDNGSTVNLYEKYYITNGITWYQSKYKAVLRNNDLQTFLDADAKFQNRKSVSI